MSQDVGVHFQEVGREWGVTTGRKRRCGWLDLVLLKYSTAVNHYTSLNLTKLDILDGLKELKIAVAYKVDGVELESFPADLDVLAKVEPVYKTLPGWSSPTTKLTEFSQLPVEANNYIAFIEEYIGVSVDYIGVGPGREHMLKR